MTTSNATADGTARNVGSLLTRIPGRARPRSQVLAEFEEGVADLRRRMDPVFWPLFVPEVADMFRWRVKLECGCVREVLTRGEDRYPDQSSRKDPISGYRLPEGEYWCSGEHATTKPFRCQRRLKTDQVSTVEK